MDMIFSITKYLDLLLISLIRLTYIYVLFLVDYLFDFQGLSCLASLVLKLSYHNNIGNLKITAFRHPREIFTFTGELTISHSQGSIKVGRLDINHQWKGLFGTEFNTLNNHPSSIEKFHHPEKKEQEVGRQRWEINATEAQEFEPMNRLIIWDKGLKKIVLVVTSEKEPSNLFFQSHAQRTNSNLVR